LLKQIREKFLTDNSQNALFNAKLGSYARQEEEAEAATRQSWTLQEDISKVAQGDEEAAVEPWFPALEDAVAANQEALAYHGQGNHALLRPDVLQGALDRARNYWAYEGDLMKAAAALAHGVAQAQAFEDGNKRTAYGLTVYFLHQNGIPHACPEDDEEFADYLIGFGEGTHTLEQVADLFRQRTMGKQANILDPIHETLSPLVWDNPANDRPTLKRQHRDWITREVVRVLDEGGYDNPEDWLRLVFTGSLTTYQYSEHSDVDISLFVNSSVFPEWSRADMIGLVVEKIDDELLPGTPYPMQCYVVPRDIEATDLYQPGMRSGYDMGTEKWIVPPDRDRVKDIEGEMHETYAYALEVTDKMDRLLKYEPMKAGKFYKQLHRRRKRDMVAGKGDFSESNIAYKMLANKGYFPRIEEVIGQRIAAVPESPDTESNAHTFWTGIDQGWSFDAPNGDGLSSTTSASEQFST